MTFLRTAMACMNILHTVIAEASGCGASLHDERALGTATNVSITSDGIQRSYLIFIPENYNTFTPAALILSYHGGNRNASSQMALDELTNPEFNTASVVIYPQGINNQWQGAPGVATNDTQFTADILNEVESLYCIDASHISATGKSEGGGFVNILACDFEASIRFAAFAPVSGAYYVDISPCEPTNVVLPCSPGRENIPMLTFHGGDDTVIPYLGGEQRGACLPTIPNFIQQWSVRDRLGNTNLTTLIGHDTWTYMFNETNPGLTGLVYESNIGHNWPSTVPNSDNTLSGQHVANYNATPIILEFFHAHTLPSNSATTSATMPSSTTVPATTTSAKSNAISYRRSQLLYYLLIPIILSL